MKLNDRPTAQPVKKLEPPGLDMQLPAVTETARASRKKWIIIGLCAVVALLVAVVASAWWWYNDALKPRSADSAAARVRVIIDRGATSDVIAKQLQQNGVIKSAAAFTLYVRYHNDRTSLRAGNYLFSPAQSVAGIVDWLVQGKVDTRDVTIYPNSTLTQIKSQLKKQGFTDAIDAAFAKPYSHPLLADKPAQATLEGYIYPETYQVTSDTTVEQLLTRSFDEFNQQIEAAGLRQALAARGFTLYQGITLASIIGKEVANEADQKQVAQVFEKRLAVDMPLGADSTFVYAAHLLGQAPSVTIDSPYNTRINKGLPPGPIANVTLPLLDAVAHPASGDYLFFVSGDDGVTHFAKTADEHDANVRQYCTKLCQAQ